MAPPAVTIQGKVYLPDGSVATSGSIVAALSLSGSVDDGGVSQRVGGRRTFTIEPDGDIETGAALIPNTTITPAGTFYRVTFNITAPVNAVWSEAWSLAAAPNPIEIGDIVRLDITGGPTGAAAPILQGIIDAKGDLIAGTAADTPARLAVGADGSLLTADSAQAAGVRWAAAPPVIRSFNSLGITPYVTTASSVGVSDNQAMVIGFYLPFSAVFDRYTYRIGTAAPANPSGFLAIYAEDGLSKVWSADSLDWTVGGVKTHTLAEVTLPAGRYLFAAGFKSSVTRIFTSSSMGINNIWRGSNGIAVADGAVSPATIPNITGAANLSSPIVHFYRNAP